MLQRLFGGGLAAALARPAGQVAPGVVELEEAQRLGVGVDQGPEGDLARHRIGDLLHGRLRRAGVAAPGRAECALQRLAIVVRQIGRGRRRRTDQGQGMPGCDVAAADGRACRSRGGTGPCWPAQRPVSAGRASAAGRDGVGWAARGTRAMAAQPRPTRERFGRRVIGQTTPTTDTFSDSPPGARRVAGGALAAILSAPNRRTATLAALNSRHFADLPCPASVQRRPSRARHAVPRRRGRRGRRSCAWSSARSPAACTAWCPSAPPARPRPSATTSTAGWSSCASRPRAAACR